MNWLQSVMMGFTSGLCEPMPLSAEAHRGLLRHFFDLESEGALFLLLCHIAVLTVVLWAGKLELRRLRRTAKLLRTPARRRTGHPNLNSAGTLRLLRPAALLAVIGRLLAVHLGFVADRLYLLPFPLLLSGLLLWLPTQLRTANKDGRHLTAADGALMGLGALASAVPGISLVGATVSIGSIRGAQRQYAVRFAWLLLVVSLMTAIVMDLLAVAGTGFRFGLTELLSAGIGAVSAAAGAYLSIHAVRALARPAADGFGGFCYYNWGQALLCLALFLLV